MSEPVGHPAGPPAGQYRRQVLRNGAASVLANGWTILLTLASIPLVLHGLGRTAFGVWALLQTFSALSGWFSLADAGIGVATTRGVADRAGNDDHVGAARVAGTGVGLVALLAVAGGTGFAVLGLVGFSAAFRVPDHLHDDVRVAVLAFAVQVVADLVGSAMGFCLDGLQRVDLARSVDSLRRTLIVGASVAAALAGAGLAGVGIAAAAAAVVGTGCYAVVLRRRLAAPARFHRATAGELLHYGRRVWLLNSTGVIHRTMDRLIIGVLLGPASVALAEIATQVQNGVAAVLAATSYGATSSAAWVRGRSAPDRLHELLLRGTKYTCLATLPLCALVAVLAGPLVRAWVGPSFAGAAVLVALAVAYLATQAPLAIGSNVLVGVGRAGDVLRPAAAAVAVNLVVSVLLVHRFGVEGGFLGTIVGGVVLTPFLARVIARETGVAPGDLVRHAVVPCLAPAAAAAALAGGVLALSLPPIPTAALGLVAGGAGWLVVALRWSLDPAERGELAGIVRRR